MEVITANSATSDEFEELLTQCKSAVMRLAEFPFGTGCANVEIPGPIETGPRMEETLIEEKRDDVLCDVNYERLYVHAREEISYLEHELLKRKGSSASALDQLSTLQETIVKKNEEIRKNAVATESLRKQLVAATDSVSVLEQKAKSISESTMDISRRLDSAESRMSATQRLYSGMMGKKESFEAVLDASEALIERFLKLCRDRVRRIIQLESDLASVRMNLEHVQKAAIDERREHELLVIANERTSKRCRQLEETVNEDEKLALLLETSVRQGLERERLLKEEVMRLRKQLVESVYVLEPQQYCRTNEELMSEQQGEPHPALASVESDVESLTTKGSDYECLSGLFIDADRADAGAADGPSTEQADEVGEAALVKVTVEQNSAERSPKEPCPVQIVLSAGQNRGRSRRTSSRKKGQALHRLK